MKNLGLDLSTTTCGYAIAENNKIIDAGFVDISKEDEYKGKAWLLINMMENKEFDTICVEETLAGFSFGRTSQNIILMLAKNKAVICYILEERFNKKIKSLNVNTARKTVLGKCREKGVKSKVFVEANLSLIHDIHKFDVVNKKGTPDKRNSDIYDAMILALATV